MIRSGDTILLQIVLCIGLIFQYNIPDRHSHSRVTSRSFVIGGRKVLVAIIIIIALALVVPRWKVCLLYEHPEAVLLRSTRGLCSGSSRWDRGGRFGCSWFFGRWWRWLSRLGLGRGALCSGACLFAGRTTACTVTTAIVVITDSYAGLVPPASLINCVACIPAATASVPTVASVLGHSVLVAVPVPHRRLLHILTVRRWTCVLVHLQLNLLVGMLQLTMRDAIVEVHDEAWKRTRQRDVNYQWCRLLNYSHPPKDIQTVNLTSVSMLSLKIRYTLTVIAIVGMNGSPGVRNARAYLWTRGQGLIWSSSVPLFFFAHLFWGCLEITNSITIIPITRLVINNPANVPVNPMAAIKSRKKMNTYITPTSFVTCIPLSYVAGPALIHGKKPGQRYEYSAILRPIKPAPIVSKVFA